MFEVKSCLNLRLEYFIWKKIDPLNLNPIKCNLARLAHWEIYPFLFQCDFLSLEILFIHAFEVRVFIEGHKN